MQALMMYSFHTKERDTLPITQTGHSVTFLIPFRNECDVLKDCVDSIVKQAAALVQYEILLLDDHSDDGSSDIARQLSQTQDSIHYIRCTKHGKKHALAEGNQRANHAWIFTADADCTYNDVRFNDLVSYTSSKALDVLALPVLIKPSSSFSGNYQFWDSLGLMLVTVNALHHRWFLSASGAAMLYRKKSFCSIKPYDDNFRIASGDDQFLLYAFRQKGLRQLQMMKHVDQKVWTKAASNWRDIVQQRLRWASKSQILRDGVLNLFLQINGAANLMIVLGLPLSLFEIRILYGVLLIYGLKMAVEGVLLYSAAHFWKVQSKGKYLLLTTLIQPFLVVFIVTNYVFKKRIIWKNRYIKHN